MLIVVVAWTDDNKNDWIQCFYNLIKDIYFLSFTHNYHLYPLYPKTDSNHNNPIMMQHIPPAMHATTHHGKFRAPNVVSLEAFYEECEPVEARGFYYDLDGDKMVNLRPFHHTTRLPVARSMTQLVRNIPRTHILLVDARWSPEKGAREMDGFFNHILPPSEVKNCDGFVGIGILRWVKTIFLLLLTAENDQVQVYREAFFRIMRFTHRLVKLDKMTYQDTWFGPVRAAMDGRKMEDVLIESLAEAVLGYTKSSARSFRSFELALRRNLGRNPELRSNMLTSLVLLFKTYLIRDDMRDDHALDRAFRVMDLETSSFSNIGMVRILLSEMYPELVPHAAAILEAATSSTKWNEVSFYPLDTDVVFSDGSALRVRKPLPMGLKTLEGEISDIAMDLEKLSIYDQSLVYSLTVDHMNNYTPVLFDIPTEGKVTLNLWGQPMMDTRVNKHGPGILVRAHTACPTRTDAFKGVLGPTFVGGIGNGLGKPSSLRPRPAFLEGTDSTVLLGSVTMDRRGIELSSPSWETPMYFSHENGNYGAVYFKGIRDITFTIDHHHPSPPSTPAAGFRVSEIVGSRFRSIQERATAFM